MTENWMESNRVHVIGEVISGFRYSHEMFGEGFYVMDMKVMRLSGQPDEIPVMVSERLISTEDDLRGQILEINGQYRSYDRHEEGRGRLVLSVFARDVEILGELPAACEDTNRIFLEGYVCKTPTYRKTPLGREIADLLLAVNRPYGKSDYIPCICWGRDAKLASRLGIGAAVKVTGRIQSREYEKRISETESETRVAYEVSVRRLETGHDENKSVGEVQ